MTEGTRSNLWVAMREAIAQLRPSLVVWENVRGAGSAEATSDLEFCAGCMGDSWYRGTVLRALGRVVGDLSELGYVGQVRGLRAADIGAPHGRFRYFLTAELADPSSDSGRVQHRDGGPTGNAALAAWRGTQQQHLPEAAGQAAEPGESAGAAARLLPTPSCSDTNGAGQHGDGGLDLRTAVSLMPTPQARDWKGAGPADMNRHDPNLSAIGALLPTPADWGIYADAIARWEALTRPASAPTQPSKKGTPQLSAAFSEWLMGLPAGWVTDVPGITRNEALKALGNGVVPQQAEAALRAMLTHLEVAA